MFVSYTSLMLLCVLDFGEYVYVVILFFFFKQKTAYEMRISDWSSDVCSSDLGRIGQGRVGHLCAGLRQRDRGQRRARRHAEARQRGCRGRRLDVQADAERSGRTRRVDGRKSLRGDRREIVRSDEHTSELHSLIRISYAVSCLKKNTRR